MYVHTEHTPVQARLLDGLLPLRHAAVEGRHRLPQPVWMARYLAREASSRLRILHNHSLHEGDLGAELHADMGRQMLADFDTWCSMPAGTGPWPRTEALDAAQVETFAREMHLLARNEQGPLADVLINVADVAVQRAADLAMPAEGTGPGARGAA